MTGLDGSEPARWRAMQPCSDELAFSTWYSREHTRVLAALVLVAGDLELARDAVDEAFCRALARWGQVGQLASSTGWVYVEELRHRVRCRHRRHRVGAGALSVVLAGIVAGLVLQPTAPPAVGLSTQVTAFTASGPPHLLNQAVRFGHLPPAMHLASDRQTNTLISPASYTRSITYTGQGPSGAESFTMTVTDSTVNPVFTSPPRKTGGISSATSTTVQGHRALAMTLVTTPQVTVTHGTSHGRPFTSYSITGYCPTSGMKSCTVQLPGGGTFTMPPTTGPPVPPASTTVQPTVMLQWPEGTDLGFVIDASGLSVAQVEQIADGVTYDPAIGNCIVAGHDTTTGLCSPGVHSSPPVTTPEVPAGGTELAYGTTAGQPWVFSAAIEPGNAWTSLVFEHTEVSGSGSSSPATAMSWDSAPDGENFLSGMVPDWVTSLSATSDGRTERSAVLPTHIGHWAYYVLPMGRATGSCNGSCPIPVHVTFYDGTTPVGHTSLSTTASSYSGFALRQPRS